MGELQGPCASALRVLEKLWPRMLFDPCPAIVDIFMAEISLSYCFGLRIFDCEQMSCSSCIMGILSHKLVD